MTHPYQGAAPHRLWRKAVTALGPSTDPVVDFPFRVARTDKVVAAGSCFAQNISSRLQAGGYDFLVTETPHPLLPPETASLYNYGRFSARYGNIYTARQLLQLLRRAYGRFTPVEDVWIESEACFIDPFRPQIQPKGFASQAEYWADREQHFRAVRQAFETMDVFVFTLGLTECWESKADGAVFTVCPGTAGGRFDAASHGFRNQDVNEVVSDLSSFLSELKTVNDRVRVILTVSPVALVATAGEGHVLTATLYSKSVLRVAADMVARAHPEVAYFPSYEIITGPQADGAYFEADRRSVSEAGVDRVMQLFFQHVAEDAEAAPSSRPPSEAQTAHARHSARAAQMIDALCDEMQLDPGD